MQKPHILFCLSFFQTRLKYVQHFLIDYLSEEGYKITILTSNQVTIDWRGYVPKEEVAASGIFEEKNYTLIRVPCIMKQSKPFPKQLSLLRQYMGNTPYDILHTDGIAGFFPQLCYKFNQTGHQKPVFINDHSNPNLKSSSFLGKLYYKANIWHFSKYNKLVRGVICPNKASHDLIKNRYGLEKVHIIPLGYDDAIFHYNPKLKNRSAKTILGFAGKIDPLKRLPFLFETLSALPNKFELHIAGFQDNAYCHSLKTLATNLGLEVMWLPLLSPTQLADFYNYIDLAVFPGSISITTLEATGCGTPILLYNSIDGLEDRVENGRGHLFSSKQELINHLSHFNKGQANNRLTSRNSKTFSWSALLANYTDLYKSTPPNN